MRMMFFLWMTWSIWLWPGYFSTWFWIFHRWIRNISVVQSTWVHHEPWPGYVCVRTYSWGQWIEYDISYYSIDIHNYQLELCHNYQKIPLGIDVSDSGWNIGIFSSPHVQVLAYNISDGHRYFRVDIDMVLIGIIKCGKLFWIQYLWDQNIYRSSLKQLQLVMYTPSPHGMTKPLRLWRRLPVGKAFEFIRYEIDE